MALTDKSKSQQSKLAHGLGNAHYIDPDVHARENEAVLFSSWASIGFAKDIPNPGDASPVEFLGRPLLLVRTQDGEVRVFENVCRHRGMVLVEKPTTFKGVIRCPYHSWCYNFNGALKTTPHVGGPGIHEHPDMNKEDLGLAPVRSQVWMDTIFVNISGDGPEFSDYIAPVEARWAEFMGKPIFHGGEDSSFQLEVNCNWKLAVENYCESYHLPWVHPALNQYSKLEDHYEIIEENGQFSGQGTRVYAPSLDETGRRFSEFEGLSEKWNTAGEYISLFPNTLLGIHKDHFYAISIEPLSNAKTREHVEIYYADEEMTAGEWSRMREANSKMWKTVFLEDVFAVQGMQKGRSAPGFDGGTLSPIMDRPTRIFHEWVGEKFAAAEKL